MKIDLKKVKKRVYKSKKKALKRVTTRPLSIARIGEGFPKKLITTCKYTDYRQMASTAVMTHYQYRLNSIYDPDITSAGLSTLNYAKLFGTSASTGLYNHWVVLGAKMKITISGYEGNSCPVLGVLWVNDDQTVQSTNYQIIASYPNAKKWMIGDGDNHISRTIKFSATKTYGKNILANSQLKGAWNSDCTEQSVGVISFLPVDSASTVNIGVLTEIEYIVCCFEPKDVTA